MHPQGYDFLVHPKYTHQTYTPTNMRCKTFRHTHTHLQRDKEIEDRNNGAFTHAGQGVWTGHGKPQPTRSFTPSVQHAARHKGGTGAKSNFTPIYNPPSKLKDDAPQGTPERI